MSSPSSNLRVWFARGYSARRKSPEYPRGVDFKNDRLRELNFRNGWEEAHVDCDRASDGTAFNWAQVDAKEKAIWQSVRDHGLQPA